RECSRTATTVPLCELETPDALLRRAVEVRIVLVSREHACFEHRLDQRAHRTAVGHAERTADAVELVLAPFVVLRPLEVRQDVVVAPAPAPVGPPAVEVAPVAAHVDHRVDRAGAADHLAA